MKKILLTGICSVLALAGWAQGIKPTMMVVPEDNWCRNNGYVKEDGQTIDYEKALSNDEMRGSIIVMNDIMAGVGYPMESLQHRLGDLHTEAAMDMVAQSKGGGDIIEDDLDKLLRSANADIVIKLGLNYKPAGPRKIVEFQVESVDAASGKTIQGEIGNSTPSNAPANALVNEAVGGFMNNFLARIDQYFSDVERNGREGRLVFKIAEDSPYTMIDEIEIPGVGEGELRDYIEYWLGEHTIDNSPRAGQSSKAMAEYSQVRFPLFGVRTSGFGKDKAKPVAMTAEKFIKDIVPSLQSLGMSAYVIPQGIGKATIIIGGK